MFHFIFIILLLIIIVPILFVGGIIGTIWRMLKGNYNGNQRNGYSSRTGGYGQSASSNNQQQSSNRGSSRGEQQQSSGGNRGNHQKIFKENQGEYVDFEEVE